MKTAKNKLEADKQLAQTLTGDARGQAMKNAEEAYKAARVSANNTLEQTKKTIQSQMQSERQACLPAPSIAQANQ